MEFFWRKIVIRIIVLCTVFVIVLQNPNKINSKYSFLSQKPRWFEPFSRSQICRGNTLNRFYKVNVFKFVNSFKKCRNLIFEFDIVTFGENL